MDVKFTRSYTFLHRVLLLQNFTLAQLLQHRVVILTLQDLEALATLHTLPQVLLIVLLVDHTVDHRYIIQVILLLALLLGVHVAGLQELIVLDVLFDQLGLGQQVVVVFVFEGLFQGFHFAFELDVFPGEKGELVVYIVLRFERFV